MIPPVEEICDCPATPVNRWYRAGRLIEERELREDTGAADAEAFNSSGADAWVICCPDCGQVFITGPV